MPLNNVARSAIEELRALGVDDLTPDEVVRLNDLGEAQARAGKARGGVAFVPVLEVGGVVFRSPSLAAMDLLERLGGGSAPNTLLSAFVCQADPAALSAIETERQLARAVRAFRRRCGATLPQLEEAVRMLFGEGEFEADEQMRAAIRQVADFAGTRLPGFGAAIREKCLAMLRDAERRREEAGEDSDYGIWRKIAVELAAFTGVPPDYWMREDHRAALLAYRTATDTIQAPARGLAEAFGAESRKEPPPEAVRALAETRRAIAAIYSARKERNNGKRKQGS